MREIAPLEKQFSLGICMKNEKINYLSHSEPMYFKLSKQTFCWGDMETIRCTLPSKHQKFSFCQLIGHRAFRFSSLSTIFTAISSRSSQKPFEIERSILSASFAGKMKTLLFHDSRQWLTTFSVGPDFPIILNH